MARGHSFIVLAKNYLTKLGLNYKLRGLKNRMLKLLCFSISFVETVHSVSIEGITVALQEGTNEVLAVIWKMASIMALVEVLVVVSVVVSVELSMVVLVESSVVVFVLVSVLLLVVVQVVVSLVVVIFEVVSVMTSVVSGICSVIGRSLNRMET